MTTTDRPSRVRARTTHTCPCGCGKRIPRTRLLCQASWERVPSELQQGAHQADAAWMAAMDDVVTWVRTHPADGANTTDARPSDGATGDTR